MLLQKEKRELIAMRFSEARRSSSVKERRLSKGDGSSHRSTVSLSFPDNVSSAVKQDNSDVSSIRFRMKMLMHTIDERRFVELESPAAMKYTFNPCFVIALISVLISFYEIMN